MNYKYKAHHQRIIALMTRIGLKLKAKLIDEGSGEITKFQSFIIGSLIFGSVSVVEYESVKAILDIEKVSYEFFIISSSVTGGVLGVFVNLNHSLIRSIVEKFKR